MSIIPIVQTALSPEALDVAHTIAPYSSEMLHLLDDPHEWPSFGRVSAHDDSVWESNVHIEGMRCATCSLEVEDALTQVPGVISAQVSAASQRAKVVWASTKVLPSVWLQAVQKAGYRAAPASDSLARERRRHETRQALWRWAVAGLCMMQVMMYAYPAYIAHPGDLSDEMEQLLRWASWVLTLPVLLFSCGPFFQSAIKDVVHRRISMDLPVALGMGIAFLVSTVGTFEPQGIFGREVYFDSLTMFVFFLLTGRWLELRLRDRTAGSLEALMHRLPDSVERLGADGKFTRVAARRIVAGDLVRVQAGEAFFADGVVEQGSTMVDEALLSGESYPLVRNTGDLVIAGSHNLSGTVHVRVQGVGEATRFAQIVALMESAASTKPHAAMLADRIAKPFLLAVLVAAAASCAWWWQVDPGHALMVAVAVLVVTCPCALSLATPAAMLASAGALARAGVLVRNLQALDTLAEVDTLVFDKTGTLTKDAFVLTAVQVRAGFDSAQALAMASALARHSLHPVSRALCAAVPDVPAKWRCDAVQEVAGQGVSGLVFDATPGDTPQTMAMRLGSASFCEVSPALGAGLHVFLSDAHGWLASFALQEELRAQAAQVVTALHQDGMAVHMLSGDGAESVSRVAAQAGILLTAAACTPADKLLYLNNLKSQGRKVVMVGDGLNDGPVLAGAHVAFALGQAVPLAQAKADFVLLGNQLPNVVLALRLARRTRAIVRQNLWWALLYNAACVPLAVMGMLPAWAAGLGMAASSLLVVLNALRLSKALRH